MFLEAKTTALSAVKKQNLKLIQTTIYKTEQINLILAAPMRIILPAPPCMTHSPLHVLCSSLTLQCTNAPQQKGSTFLEL